MKRLLVALAFALLVQPAFSQSAKIPGRSPASSGVEAPVTQLIVRFRDETPQTFAAAQGRARASALSAKGGMGMQYKRPMSGLAHVYRLAEPMPYSEAYALARRLEMSDPTIERAEPDLILRAQAVPNDPRFTTHLWHLQSPGGANAGGTNLPLAWDIATGNNIVVGVVDTGDISHPDLSPNVIGGYDFITNITTARDGSERDANAQDEGTWWDLASECSSQAPQRSSWHGAHVAGTIAAVGNNGQGVAGVAYNARVLQLRALGKCGSGLFSDIIDAIRWGAGLPASRNGQTWASLGIPANTTPARVINLSLGGTGACAPNSEAQAAINEARGAGVVIVAATGNDGNLSIGVPANCSGVIAVTAHTYQGDSADYANVGPGTKVSAPGGGACTTPDSGNFTCLTPYTLASTAPNFNNVWVWSTQLFGAKGPTSAASSTDTQTGPAYGGKAGTSMASPHVAGVAALLLSRMPTLSPDEVESLIVNSARAHPAGLYCAGQTDNRCGRGLLDGRAALVRLESRVPTLAVTAPQTVAGGQVASLVAAATPTGGGSSVFTYNWRQTAGPAVTLSNAQAATASFVGVNPGGVHTFEVSARDANGYEVKQTVSVRSNNTPTMNAVAAQSVQQGGNLVFSVVGTDPDGDPLTYVATGLPAGATFTAATGQFSWTSVGVSPGNFTFSVVANDGIVSSAAVTVGVTVTAASSGASPPPGGGGGGGVGGSLPASGLAVLLLAALLRRGRAHH